jgi:DNA-binding NarL/FixJ family response regulator
MAGEMACAPGRLLILEGARTAGYCITSLARAAYPNAELFVTTTMRDASAQLMRSNLDIALIDLELTRDSSVEFLRECRRLRPMMPCVVIGDLVDDERIISLMAAGLQGYLLKDQPAALLIECLRRLGDGVPPLLPAITPRLVAYMANAANGAGGGSGRTPLSARERGVLQLIAGGKHVTQVANELHLSAHTVCSHLKSIYRKLDVSSRASAALAARRLGLI